MYKHVPILIISHKVPMKKTANSIDEITFCDKPKHKSFKDKTGKKFNMLTVLGMASKEPRHHFYWCQCDCGKIYTVRSTCLGSPSQISCGCHKMSINNIPRHGGWGSLEYGIYRQAKQRCTNPNNNSYERYGGRGIEFRFTCYEDFIEELGPRPSRDYSIDRIDNDGHYEKDNVRWATAKQQANNKRNNK